MIVAFALLALIVLGGLLFAIGIWRDLPLLILVGSVLVVLGVIQSLRGSAPSGDQTVQQRSGKRP